MRGAWWVWIGGILGAIYVGSAVVVTPKLGASGFIILVVVGQIFIGLLIDHFGLMGLASKPITFLKLIGAAMILGGVFLVQGFSANVTSQPKESIVQRV
ncbi:putative inner membrane exporter, YdcZ [compost metagenome]